MSLRLSIISANIANIAICMQKNAIKIVLSVISLSINMSKMALIPNNAAKKMNNGINSRIGAKYMPVLVMSCINRSVSFMGLM